jgi:hypothetical protein
MTATIKLIVPKKPPRLVHVDKDDPAMLILAEISRSREMLGLRWEASAPHMVVCHKIVKLLSSAPSTLLLWEPWEAGIFIEEWGQYEGRSNFKILASFPPTTVHPIGKSLSSLWVAGQKCDRCGGNGLWVISPHGPGGHSSHPCNFCKGTGYGTTGEGRDQSGNSVKIELGPVEIGFAIFPNNPLLGDRMDFKWPPRLVTRPMRAKVTVELSGKKIWSFSEATIGARTLSCTVDLPSMAIQHPLFPVESEGVSSVGNLE